MEWAAFFEVEPWGSEIEWLKVGTVAAMIGNAAPNRRRNSKGFNAADFVPKFKPSARRRKKVDPKLQAQKTMAEFKSVFGARMKPAKKGD